MEFDGLVRAAIATILALSLVGTAANCRGEKTLEAQHVYIVFIDLSLSLNDIQNNSQSQLLDQVVRGMSGGSRLIAFPIGEKVVPLGPLFDVTLPRGDNATDRVRLRKIRQTLTPRLLATVSSARETLKTGTVLKHTCISDALRQASHEVRDMKSAGVGEIEIVFVSDMLEDCPTSLLGRPVTLEKPDIRPEISLARSVPEHGLLLDLRKSRVTMLLPPLALAEPKTPRPPEYDVEAFWRAVLDHCNDERQAFRFGTVVPERLRNPPKA